MRWFRIRNLSYDYFHSEICHKVIYTTQQIFAFNLIKHNGYSNRLVSFVDFKSVFKFSLICLSFLLAISAVSYYWPSYGCDPRAHFSDAFVTIYITFDHSVYLSYETIFRFVIACLFLQTFFLKVSKATVKQHVGCMLR